MWSWIHCIISLGTLGFDSIILSSKILLAISSLLASSKLLTLLCHSSCSKYKGGNGEVEDGGNGEVEDGGNGEGEGEGNGEGEGEDEEELFTSGKGML